MKIKLGSLYKIIFILFAESPCLRGGVMDKLQAERERGITVKVRFAVYR